MRGSDERAGSLFSYVDLEARVPKGHPPRAIREIVNTGLADLNAAFEPLYSRQGRPSIAPEKLLRASLLQAFYSIRSERLASFRREASETTREIRYFFNSLLACAAHCRIPFDKAFLIERAASFITAPKLDPRLR